MTNIVLPIMSTMFVGIGATLTMDLWAFILKYAFKITPSDFCLVGRWIRYMQEGIYQHTGIASAMPKSQECTIGWIAHYVTGVVFAIAFIALAGNEWLQRPALIPAIVFGIVTVAAPFLVLQPALGLGLAASRASNPVQARLRTLMNHTVFGIGLYLFGSLVSVLPYK